MSKPIVENYEALKVWLTKTLTPICDADPVTLAKYVVALAKKSKPTDELRELCMRELEVFLQEKTGDFVDQLFVSLDNKSYLEGAPPQPTAPVARPAPVAPKKPPPLISTPPTTTSNNNNNSDTVHTAQPDQPRTSPPPHRRPLRERPYSDRDHRENRNDNNQRSRRSRSFSPNRNRRDDLRRDDLRRRIQDRRPDGGDRGRPPYNRFRGRHSPEFHRRRSPVGRRMDRSPPGGPNRRGSPPPRRRSPRRSPLNRQSPGAATRSSHKARSWSRSRSREKQPSQRARTRSRSRPPRSSRSRSRLARSRSRSRPPRSRSTSLSSDSSGGRRRRRSRSRDSRGSTPLGEYSLDRKINRPIDDPKAQRVRCRDYDEKGFCMRGDMCPFDHGSDPVVVDDVNLPGVLTFQGSRPPPPIPGGLPQGPPPGAPPPHGPPPLNGPPPVRPPIRGPPDGPPGPRMPPIRGEANPPPPGTEPLQQAAQNYPPPSHPMPVEPYHPEPFNPTRLSAPRYPPPPLPGHPDRPPDMWQRGPPPMGPRMGGPPPHRPPLHTGPPPAISDGERTRDLVTITTVQDDPSVSHTEAGSTVNPNRTVIAGAKRPYIQGPPRDGVPPYKRKPFHRLGPKHDVANCTLELRRVPPLMNNIAKINEHFGKFGTIVNLKVALNGDPQAASVTFASPAQAQSAYHSPEPIFNNRLIKVFFQRQDWTEDKDAPTQPQAGGPALLKDRLGAPPVHNTNITNKPDTDKAVDQESVMVSDSGVVTKTVLNPAALKKTNLPLQPKHTTLETFKHNRLQKEQRRKEALKKKAEITKQKQDLLEKQIGQQKLLFAKLEKAKSMSAEDKLSIVKTIKMLATSTDKLKQEIAASVPTSTPHRTSSLGEAGPGKTSTPQVKSPPSQGGRPYPDHLEAQKAILDTELDIMHTQNEGGDTSELHKKVQELKREAAALGLLGAQTRGRGMVKPYRGRGRGRGSAFGSLRSVDRRPRQLLVRQFSAEHKDDLKLHFEGFGQTENSSFSEDLSTFSVTYSIRAEAEKAFHEGVPFHGKLLEITWAQHSPSTESTPPKYPLGANVAPDTDTATPTDTKHSEALAEETEDAGESEQALVGETDDAVDTEDGAAEEPLDDVDEDVLLGMDEEDDDDDGERSWKR